MGDGGASDDCDGHNRPQHDRVRRMEMSRAQDMTHLKPWYGFFLIILKSFLNLLISILYISYRMKYTILYMMTE